MHEYYYGAQPSQFTFYRVPMLLFTDEQYKYASTEAKVLYGILHSRMELSAKNGWLDEKNRVFIIFTIDEIKEKLGCGNKKAIQLLDELEDKLGLIERKRQGLGKPNLIYVKNFLSVDNPVEGHFLKCQNHTSGSVQTTFQEVSESHASNKDKKYIDQSYTDIPFLSGREANGTTEYERYKSYFFNELEMDILFQSYPTEKETLEGILELLVEICCSKRKEIRIAGDDKPKDVVKSRLMKLNSSHIQYVLGCLKDNVTDVRDMKQYLLSILYNAPVTISPYYQSKVNHDFYGHY